MQSPVKKIHSVFRNSKQTKYDKALLEVYFFILFTETLGNIKSPDNQNEKIFIHFRESFRIWKQSKQTLSNFQKQHFMEKSDIYWDNLGKFGSK